MNRPSSTNKKIKVIAIVGATASGKTAFSIELAKKINGEIISADSRLVYKGFDIGTAKPTKDEMQGIPHYMIDIVEPEFDYSAGLYQNQAKEKIYDIAKKGKTPVIVGGTGLYIDILLKNFELPAFEPDTKLRKTFENYSSEELFKILKSKDAEGAETIEKNDRKKIIRAIEIINYTQKPLADSRGIGECEFEVEWIGCNHPRDILYERINNRVDFMLKQGLIDETKSLIKKHGRLYNITNTIGYREITHYLDGEMSLEESIELLKQNTRKYAKRQLTWFRKNEDIKWNIFPEKLKK